jgi:hypothetical protein
MINLQANFYTFAYYNVELGNKFDKLLPPLSFVRRQLIFHFWYNVGRAGLLELAVNVLSAWSRRVDIDMLDRVAKRMKGVFRLSC